MCSAPSIKVPEPQPLPQPTPEELAAQQQMDYTKAGLMSRAVLPGVPQPNYLEQRPTAPLPPTPNRPEIPSAVPPPTSARGEDVPVIKRRKSERAVLQQKSSGAAALRINPDKTPAIGPASTGATTKKIGLNIPK